jgi:hypothetical protein
VFGDRDNLRRFVRWSRLVQLPDVYLFIRDDLHEQRIGRSERLQQRLLRCPARARVPRQLHLFGDFLQGELRDQRRLPS